MVIRVPPSTLPAVPVIVVWPVVLALVVINPTLGTGGGIVSGTVTVMLTVSGSLSTVPSLTMSCTTWVPATSGTKVGFTIAALDNAVALPVGTEANDQK